MFSKFRSNLFTSYLGIRFRHIFFGLGSVTVLALYMATDPDAGIIQNLPVGAGTLAMMVILLKAILYVVLLHYSRKAIFDYINLRTLILQTKEDPVGAGLSVIGISIFVLAVSIVIYAATA